MIVPDNADWPNNVTLALKPSLATIPGVDATFTRRLRTTDPDCCVAIFAVHWNPEEVEIGGSPDPSISRYYFAIQALVRHTDEALGLAAHAYLSKVIRQQIYRVGSTRSALTSLSYTTPDGMTEAFGRLSIDKQTFLSQDGPAGSGSFMWLSTLDWWVETFTG